MRQGVSDTAAQTIAEAIRAQLAAEVVDEAEFGVAVSLADVVQGQSPSANESLRSSLVTVALGSSFEEPRWSRRLPVFDSGLQHEAVAAVGRERRSWSLPIDDALSTLRGPIVIDVFAAADLLRAMAPALARGALSPSLLRTGWKIVDRGALIDSQRDSDGVDDRVVILGDGTSRTADESPFLVSESWRKAPVPGFRSLTLESPSSPVAIDASWPVVTRLIGLRGGLLAFGFDRRRRFVARADHLGEALLGASAAVSEPVVDASGLPVESPAVLTEL